MVRRKTSENPFTIYFWFIQLLIVLSLVAVVIWLSTKPLSPRFNVTAITIPETGNRNSTKVQENETPRNNSVSFDLEITNPNNGMTICYIEIDVKLYNGGVYFGSKYLSSFCEGRKKTVTEEVVTDADRGFRAGNAGGGVELRLTVETVVRYRIFKWNTKVHHMGFEGFVRIDNQRNITENINLHKIP